MIFGKDRDSRRIWRVRIWGMRLGISITLTAADRRHLEAIIRNRNAPQKHVWRAAIVLLSDDGGSGFRQGQAVVGPMPPFGEYIKTDDDLWKIIAWMRSVNCERRAAGC
jgi:hypothetical protein